MKTELRIAVLSRDFPWGGGIELLRIIVNSLLSIQIEQPLRIFLLLPVENRIDTFSDLRGVILKTAGPLIRHQKWISPKPRRLFDARFPDYFKNVDGQVEMVEYNPEAGLIPVLQRIKSDVVIPVGTSLGSTFPYPWVGYIYDFQHKYLPNYFSSKEMLGREIHFATMLRDARAVIVNAQAVKNDINTFYPYSECEVFNLPFSAAPIMSWLDADILAIRERYNLPERYFLISNQFWIHKSHSTAFEALKLIYDEGCGSDLHIVCTGKMDDYRFPDYIQRLQLEIEGLGITDRIHFLGHIPKIDQIAIMKNSLAVLQPTLFEGGPGGGAVYDAVALGVPAILSDIPVNREIETEANIFYFQAGSATDLADEVKAFLQRGISRPTKAELLQRGEQRKRLMGERLLEAIDFVRMSASQ